MRTIFVATKVRGFLGDLFRQENGKYKFIYEQAKSYEVNSKKKLLLSKIVKSSPADYLGLIQRIKVNCKEGDIVFSYNRFLKSDTDYIIYLENPLALVHYSTKRNKTVISKIKIHRYLNDPQLKAIVCLSKACYDTVNNFYDIPKTVKVEQIYPLVEKNILTSKESIREKCSKNEIKCLYISSNFSLKGGDEILEAFKQFQEEGITNIKLDIITQINELTDEQYQEIKSNKNINLYDFKFDKKELYALYNEACICLSPTRQDSFPLTLLEAMKSGNVIITTDLYAIPEMVDNNLNGFLAFPKYRFFDYNNMPNERVWNNRNKTIYSKYIDIKLVDFLVEKIKLLNLNRDIMEKMCLKSYETATEGKFDEQVILNKWNNLFDEIKK